MGTPRSFGNTRFGGVNHGPATAGGSHLNNINPVNRTSFANQSNVNVNRFNNFGNNLGSQNWGHGGGPYGYHRGWRNGRWGGYGGYGYGGYGYGGLGYGLFGFGLGYGLGLGLGYGGLGYGYGGYGGYGYGGYGLGYCPPSWLYGSSLYGYGYSPYSNPYYGTYATTGAGVVPYDYSQPISTVSAPVAESVADEASALFGTARDAFKQGQYETALDQANAALAKTPSDTALHEFRALCLFALGRYDEAATTLYAVLTAGPGWDWSTLIGLYPSVDVFTAQQRALEDYCKANPQSATGRFLLAYDYITEGFLDEARNLLKQVVALKPGDTLSAKLLEQVEAAAQNKAGTPSAQPPPVPVSATAPTNTAVPAGATIFGSWKAEPSPDTSIVLTLEQGGAYTWQVTQKGQTQQFAGVSTFGGGVLTLAQDNGTVLVGRVNWTDPEHMTFRVIGGGANDPGLSFSR
jgi:thioredoxin-like negative regulator of GroEL